MVSVPPVVYYSHQSEDQQQPPNEPLHNQLVSPLRTVSVSHQKKVKYSVQGIPIPLYPIDIYVPGIVDVIVVVSLTSPPSPINVNKIVGLFTIHSVVDIDYKANLYSVSVNDGSNIPSPIVLSVNFLVCIELNQSYSCRLGVKMTEMNLGRPVQVQRGLVPDKPRKPPMFESPSFAKYPSLINE